MLKEKIKQRISEVLDRKDLSLSDLGFLVSIINQLEMDNLQGNVLSMLTNLNKMVASKADKKEDEAVK